MKIDPKGKALAHAISSMDDEKLIEFAIQNKSKKNPFTFKEVLQELTDEEKDEMWAKLKEMIIKHSDAICKCKTESSNFIKKDLVCLESSQILQAAIDLAQAIVDESLPVSEGLLHMVVFLNGILFEIPTILENLRNNIAYLCEKMYHLNYVNQNQYFTFNTLIYLLKRSLSSKASKKDVKRIYALRSLIPKVLVMEDVDTCELWELFKKCTSSANYVGTVEGQKIITLTLIVDTDHVSDIHNVLLKRLCLSTCTIAIATSYGKVYFDAWSHSVKSKNEKLQNELEITCVQDLMLQAIIKREEKAVNFIRKALGQFHCQKKEAYVSKMLYTLYQPILWRYLKHPDGLIRARAAHLFLDVFPLEDPDYKVVTSDLELNEQFLIIKDLLLDDYPIVRKTAVSQLCVTMSVNWELFPEDILRTFFKIITNELSCDSSSIEVRGAVAKGFKALMENPLTMTTLQSILPKLKHLFHDVSDSVRVAFCQVLLRVKKICSVKYFDIVPFEDLVARLEEDAVTAKLIVNLLQNSFFPRGQGSDVWIMRCANIIRKSSCASRVLFQYIPNFMSPQTVATFIGQAVKAIHTFVCETEMSRRKLRSSAPRFSNRHSCGEVSGSKNSKDMYALGLTCGFSEPLMVAGFMDGFAIMWLATANNLKKTENKVHLKRMVLSLSKTLSELVLYYKNSPIFFSVAYLGSYVPYNNIPCLAALCFKRLLNMTENTDPMEYTTMLRCLCNQSQEEGLLKLLKEWIEYYFLSHPDIPPIKRRKIENVSSHYNRISHPRFAVIMFNFLLDDKLCQKTILKDKADSLSSFLDLFKPFKERVESYHQKSIPRKEVDFLTGLLSSLTKTAALMNHESSECKSIKFVDEVVSWTQDTFCRLAWPDSSRKHNSRKNSSIVEKKCSKSFEGLVVAICKDVCTLAGDIACLGFLNIKTCKYLKFAMKLLNTSKGPVFLLNVSKILWKHIHFGIMLCTLQHEESVLYVVPDCFNKIIQHLKSTNFVESIPISDAKEIYNYLSLALMTLYHHGVVKEMLSDIIFCFVKNVMADVSKTLSESWNILETECKPFSSVQVSRSSSFLISTMSNRQKILAYFLHQLNIYLSRCENNIEPWVSCCIILYQASDIKNVSKNLRKEVYTLESTLERILMRVYPLDPVEFCALAEKHLLISQTIPCDDIYADEKSKFMEEPEITNDEVLSFSLHCHFELKKLRKVLHEKDKFMQKMIEN